MEDIARKLVSSTAQVIDITDEQRPPTFGTAAVKGWSMVAITP
jgi:hypothetical protein